MAFFRRIFPLLFLIAFLSGELPLVAQDRVHGEIVRWIDGDTCDFKTDEGKMIRVQLWLADAPEPDQPLGEKVTEFVRTNANFGEGEKAELESLSQDRYERTVEVLYTPEGKSCLEEFFASGYFWYLTYPARDNPTEAAPLHRLFNTAQRARRGVFQFSTSVPPWRWRKMSDTEKEDATNQFERERQKPIYATPKTPSARKEDNSTSYNNYSTPRTQSYSYNRRYTKGKSWKKPIEIGVLILVVVAILCKIIGGGSKGKRPPPRSHSWTPPAERSREKPQSRRSWNIPKIPIQGWRWTPPKKPVVKDWELTEQWVNEELTTKLPADEYKVIYDALFEIEYEDKSTQIDHIVISPYGVFVLETKSWKGEIAGDETGEDWTQNLSGEIHYLPSPTSQNKWHIDFLKYILANNWIASTDVTFISIIVFDGSADLSVDVKNHIVVYRKQLVETILQYKDRVISFDLRNKIIKILEQNLKTDEAARARHIKRVQGNH